MRTAKPSEFDPPEVPPGNQDAAKAALRVTARRCRRQIPDRPDRSRAAVAELLASSVWAAAKNVLAYVACRSELETDALLDAAFGSKTARRRVAVPFCRPDGGLGISEVRAWEELELGAFGIPEPTEAVRRDTSRGMVAAELDLVLVPGLAFDRRGGRLGQGGGYYDRLLAELPTRTVRLGVAFRAQLVNAVPVEPHDQRVDGVVTESGLLPCRRVLGILGGIASGKSLVTRFLTRNPRVRAFDADAAGHRALELPEVHDALVRRWGPGVQGRDGSISRKNVAQIVFRPENAAELEFLNRLVHPKIREMWAEFQAQCDRDLAPTRVLDAALLLESGWGAECDTLVFLDTPQELRERHAAERGWSPEELRLREARQWPIDRKRDAAHVVISNTGSVEDLERRVAELFDV